MIDFRAVVPGAAGIALVLAIIACNDGESRASAAGTNPAADEAALAVAEASDSATFVLVGAGDIATCGRGGDSATASLLDDIPGTVFTAGDNIYPTGREEDFADCYDATWGRHKARTRPSPGNHDYRTPGAAGYFDYFGSAAGEPDRGYYSYDLGGWHVVVLNSNVDVSAESPQVAWLRQDLARLTPGTPVIPFFHYSPHAGEADWDGLANELAGSNVPVVLHGHDLLLLLHGGVLDAVIDR